jgi:hypothetical protein
MRTASGFCRLRVPVSVFETRGPLMLSLPLRVYLSGHLSNHLFDLKSDAVEWMIEKLLPVMLKFGYGSPLPFESELVGLLFVLRSNK